VADQIDDSKNKSTIRCIHCDEKVLLAGAGEYIEKEVMQCEPTYSFVGTL